MVPTTVCKTLDCAEKVYFDDTKINDDYCDVDASYSAKACKRGITVRDDWVTHTNRARCTYCSAKITWDDQLAASAQAYANTLAKEEVKCADIKNDEVYSGLGNMYAEVLNTYSSVSVPEKPDARKTVRGLWEDDLAEECDLEVAMCKEAGYPFAVMVYQYTEQMGCGYAAWRDTSLDQPTTHCNVVVCRYKMRDTNPMVMKREVSNGKPMVLYQKLYDTGFGGQWFYKPQGECPLFPRTMEFGYTCNTHVENAKELDGPLPCGVETTYILLSGANWQACSMMMEQEFSYVSCACLNSIQLDEVTKSAMGCALEGVYKGKTLLDTANECREQAGEEDSSESSEVEYENTYEVTAVEYRAKKACIDGDERWAARKYDVKVTLDYCFEFDIDDEDGIQFNKKLPSDTPEDQPTSQIVSCGRNGKLEMKYYDLAGCLGAPMKTVELGENTCEELITEDGKTVRRSWNYALPDLCEENQEASVEEDLERDLITDFVAEFDGTFNAYKAFCADAFSDDRKACKECGGKVRKDRNDNSKICLVKSAKKLKCKQINVQWCETIGCQRKEGASQCRGTPVFDDE